MHTTHHAADRMNQRGIKKAIVSLAMTEGRPDGDRFVLTRDEALTRIEALKREQKLYEDIARKGGVAVVCNGDALITTYSRLGAERRIGR